MADSTPVPGSTSPLDSQIANTGNSIVAAIKAGYGTEPLNNETISNPTAILSQRVPQNKIELPSKACSNMDIDFLNTYNNWDLNKDIKSMSLDPLIKRLIQEKNDILRAIEGWVASQANDGARQPLLGTTISKWIKKAIGYVRCGIMIITQITNLINGWITAILTLIDTITNEIMRDINAANALMNQFRTIGEQLKHEEQVLLILAEVYALQDYMALYNEIGALEKQLLALKNQFSKDHLKSMEESLLNSLLCLMNAFKRLVGRIQSNQQVVLNLKTTITNLNTQLAMVQAIDLTIPLNPGGINPGMLSNYTITNDGQMFQGYDALTQNGLLIQLNNGKIGDPNVIDNSFNQRADWTTLFTTSEVGYIVFTSDNYGALQLGVDFTMHEICPQSALIARLVINGGDWILETTISGNSDEIDDGTITAYATKNAVFTKVPNAPNPDMQLPLTFMEFISAINRPAGLVTGNSIIDPTDGSSILVPDIYNVDGDYYVIQGNIPGLTNYSAPTSYDLAVINGCTRYPTQSEIDFYEASYTAILQALNIGPVLYSPKIYNFLNDGTHALAIDYLSGVSIILSKIQLDTFTNLLRINPTISSTDAWILFNQNVLYYQAYTGTPNNVLLQFRMPFDTQLPTTLLGSKPFPGMQIYTTSLLLEMTRQAVLITNMPYFLHSDNTIHDAHVISFGLKADWGFAPIAQLI